MTLYEEIGNQLSVTEFEVRQRSISEPIVQSYYEWKYGWDLKDETTIPF